MRLRTERGWTQDHLATKLGMSKRTLSHWENGHWLPPFKQRLHVVLSLHDMPPEVVLEVADGLGVSTNPVVEPLLKPYRDALYGAQESDDDAAPTVVVSPPRPRPEPKQLRAALDAVVFAAADAMNATPNDVRAVIDRALAASGDLGGTLEDTREAVAVKVAKPKKP
ncbi:MAG: helix-turn-helix domain-containing protein [Polyangiaceae bacterium]|jgi:transcriptional regulator with XRE-family HTH domain